MRKSQITLFDHIIFEYSNNFLIGFFTDVSIELEFMKKPATPPFEPLTIFPWICAQWTREHSHQSNDLLECEFSDRTSKIILRGCLDSKNTRSELDHIQVKLKNPVLGQGLLQLSCDQIFLDFPEETFFSG